MLKVKVQGYELSILCIDLVVDLIRKQTYNCIDISTNNIGLVLISVQAVKSSKQGTECPSRLRPTLLSSKSRLS